VISLVDNFDEPEPDKPGQPCTAEDIEFWTDVFGALLPEEDEIKDYQRPSARNLRIVAVFFSR
jgi:hypothetical protein